ncbi:hypothetical protein KFE25_002859 [Diacronema lutheri]|mgnify:CR=1 FL=1|uniref:Thioesterase domain-containing protein n=1 Tax=Diacronema lutheri TaxID=2081491 RepID=A0A8J5XJK9_DIALT|nr:hypothetical protein KFE25_002859 [Diacronema lutheri]
MPHAARATAELFWRLSARTHTGGFGRALGLTLPADGGAVELRKLGATETVVAVDAPAWLCDASGVSPAGVIAIFDEVSSYVGAALWDPRCRPGISVNLSAVMSDRAAAAIGPGARLVVTSRKQRLGRTLGFIDVSVALEEAGRSELLLRGRHTKFMPGTGLRPELLSAPGPWRPLLLRAAHAYLDRMPVVPSARAPPSCFADVFPSPTAGEYVLSAAHANPLGAFHGGAAVILAAHAADRHGAASGADGRRRRVRTISANLLSGIALAGDVRVRVDAADGPGEDSVVATITRLDAVSAAKRPAAAGGSGAPFAVECTVTYAAHEARSCARA